MKKIFLVLALLPAIGFSADDDKPKTRTIFNRECDNIKDPAQRKKSCLAEEKQKEADEVFRNFQENNHIETNF